MIEKSKIKCVVFDLDDTLYSDKAYCYRGYSAVARYLQENYSIPAYKAEALLVDAFQNANDGKIFNRALSEMNIAQDQNIIQDLVVVYRNHKPDITLPKESVEILDYLKGKYSLALITDGFLPAQRLKIEALGLEKWFAFTICTEELGREFWKPSEKAYRLVMEDGGFASEECVYIADNPAKDFIAPNKLGWQSVMVEKEDSVHIQTTNDEYTVAKESVCSIKELERIL